MTWNTPTDVSTGNALTATLWNNLLGSNGSLQYLFNQFTPFVAIELYKSANTAITGSGSSVMAFDGYVGSGFPPMTGPITNISLPTVGWYIFSFAYRTSVSTNFFIRISNISNGFQLLDTGTNTSQTNTFTAIGLALATTITCTAYVTTASTLYGVSAAESSLLRIAQVK